MKENQSNSRQTNAIINAIRSSIKMGEIKKGDFLPTIRELGKDFGISFETARRGLLILASEGLIKSIPRQGFQVTENSHEDLSSQRPLAFVSKKQINDLSLSRAVSHQINIQAANRNWSVFNRFCEEDHDQFNLHELKERGIWGILLDSDNQEMIQEANNLEIPVVLINSWSEDFNISAVVQDNYLGGYQAAKWLIEQGANEILWVGPQHEYIHSRERYAGFTASFHQLTGKPPSLKCIPPGKIKDVEKKLLDLLKSKNRPEGIFSYGIHSASIISKVLSELKIEIGKDIKLIGWSVEELFESSYLPLFINSTVKPPAVTWKIDEMIDKAMSTLEEMKEQKNQSRCRICIPTQINRF